MNQELREELAAIFDRDQGVTAPLKPRRKLGTVQHEIATLEATIERIGDQYKDRMNTAIEQFQHQLANEIAPYVARIRELRDQQR